MTIDILFIAKNKLVLRVNMCFSNFERKILDEIPIEEQEKWVFEYDDNDIEKKHLPIKSSSRKSGAHAFATAILQRIMTSWESCWIQ